jgi:hypothetical protein
MKPARSEASSGALDARIWRTRRFGSASRFPSLLKDSSAKAMPATASTAATKAPSGLRTTTGIFKGHRLAGK